MRNALVSVLVLTGLTACSSGPAYANPPYPRSSDPTLQRMPPTASGPRMELVDEAASPLPTFFQDGRRFVLGATGTRYLVRIVNPSPARVEAVVSVDGLDAIDGRPGSLAKRGYIIPAYGEVTIDGWRTSLGSVAAFRFSSVRDSYAGRTGHDRNVGVIGVAFFRERPRVTWRPRQPNIARSAPPANAAPASPPAADMGNASGAAGSAASPRKAEAESRSGLGTEFGEAHTSYVEEVAFNRADPGPMTVSELRYDDREGLVARGISVPPRDAREAEIDLRDRAEPFPERFAQPPP